MPKKIPFLIKLPLVIVFFIVIGVSFGYVTFKFLSYSRVVEVPALKNMTLIEANNLLSKRNLYLKIEGEDFDVSISGGRIISQSIPAGNKVKENRSIKVIVSKGPRLFSVPYVVNETLGNAQNLLAQKGIRVGNIIHVHSDLFEKDRIISQKPEPDENLKDSITLLVSLGPHESAYYCPNFLEGSIESAREIAGKLGIVLQIDGAGDVIRAQSPVAGKLIRTGDLVRIETRDKTILEIIKEKVNG